MSVEETGSTLRLDTGHFRADWTEYYATFWKVLGAGSNPVHYMIRPREIDELMELLQDMRRRWLGEALTPKPRQLQDIGWMEFIKCKLGG